MCTEIHQETSASSDDQAIRCSSSTPQTSPTIRKGQLTSALAVHSLYLSIAANPITPPASTSLPSAPHLAHPCSPMHQSWIFQEKAIKLCRRSGGILGLDVVLLIRPSNPHCLHSQVNLYYSTSSKYQFSNATSHKFMAYFLEELRAMQSPQPAFQPPAYPTAHLASIPASCMPTPTPTPLPTHPPLLFPHP